MDMRDIDTAEHFKAMCDMERKRYPRSPVVVERATAKDIDLGGIFRMPADEIDAALLTECK